MKALLNLLILVLACHRALGQAVPDIPDSLKEGMNEVVIYDHTHFKVESIKKSYFQRSYQVLVLNKYASDRTSLMLFYDDFRSIKDAKIVYSGITGEVYEKYRLKDFNDFSAKSFSLASDSRGKYIEITPKKYPFIIEVSYSMEYETNFVCPTWNPQSDEKQSVIEASFTLEYPSDQIIRHKSINTSVDSSWTVDGIEHVKWKIKNLEGFKSERLSNGLDMTPIVFTAPEAFEMDGYLGRMDSWKGFGEWINTLNKGRNTLTQEQLVEAQKAVSGAKNKVDSIRAIYHYMQENTRYVSVQLGIGGFQPFETGYVHEQKYGDCKALSFYTKSLLESVGINSHYTLISAGRRSRDLFPDFSANYFNHAILTVPLEKDTIWLECTSQTNPFGNIGTFTGNRYALMITDEGGELIRTRDYKKADNVQSTKAMIFIEKEGKAIGRVERSYSGMEIENDGFYRTILQEPSKQKDWFVDEHDWGSFTVTDLQLHDLTDEPVPVGGFEAEIELEKFARPTGDRLFCVPFQFTNASRMKFPDKERQHPLIIKYPYMEVDSIEVVLPERFFPEKEVADKTVTTKYGNYTRSVLKTDDGYMFIRRFEMESGKYAPEEYQEFRKFIRSVQRMDRERMVLINKT